MEEKTVIPAETGEQQPPVETKVVEEDKPQPTPSVKTFTQDEVNNIVVERLKNERSKSVKEVCLKYGVNTLEELDTLIEKSKNYDKEVQEHKGTKKELLFLQNDIDESRTDDIDTYFAGKGLELNQENLTKYKETHPECVKKVAVVKPIGNDKHEIKQEEDVNKVVNQFF